MGNNTLKVSKRAEDNIGLVHFVMKRFRSSGADMEELFQVGCVGLCKASEGFDESLNLQFSTYAVPVILGEIKRFLRDNTVLHVSRGIKEKSYAIKKAREKIVLEKQRDATLEEICEETDFTMEEVVLAIESMNVVESLDAFVTQDENASTRLDMIVGCVKEQEAIVDKILCKQILEGLPERESKLLYLRYFMDMRQVEIASELGMTQVQVSRLEKKILLSLKKKYKY
ncbi:MAG: sigma-70 family RNA polymerase sigma factor [Lachnospiraceae bacterium]